MRIEQVLSKRLMAAAGLVTKGNRVADVGCDHAYTSIYLVQRGIAPSAVAMDINAGPVERARENVRLYGMEESIAVRQSDGLTALAPKEADTILISGMGGLLMKKILSDKEEAVRAARELVLQPQSETEELRRYLHSIDFNITKEAMVKEDGKFYVMFRAEPGREAAWSAAEYRYGKHLLKERPEVFLDFLRYEREQKKEIAASLTDISSRKAKERWEQLKEEVQLLEKLLIE